MSKYNALWEYIQKDGSPSFKLSFDEIQRISGTPIDHSFLKYKKELAKYGYQVGKISMKEQTVQFNKMESINIPITVEILSDAADWQLVKLENEFLEEIGEASMTEEKQTQLQQAIRDSKIIFFIARQGDHAVGMCSIVKSFSTFSCSDIGVFDDFYIEPVFRKMGIARKLAQAAQSWCRENNLASLTVCCAPCDEKMYQALGFDVSLGKTYAYLA